MPERRTRETTANVLFRVKLYFTFHTCKRIAIRFDNCWVSLQALTHGVAQEVTHTKVERAEQSAAVWRAPCAPRLSVHDSSRTPSKQAGQTVPKHDPEVGPTLHKPGWNWISAPSPRHQPHSRTHTPSPSLLPLSLFDAWNDDFCTCFGRIWS